MIMPSAHTALTSPHPDAEQAQLDAVLRTVAGKPLRASPAMDVWALGMVMWELFTNEPFFSGCSDDVVLQVSVRVRVRVRG
jgi:hypothetical protein